MDHDTKAGLTRRGALRCLAWATPAVLWTVTGGVPVASLLGHPAAAAPAAGSLHFVQISDTHIGFAKEANPDALATAKAAIDLVNRSVPDASLVLHTGDITHLSKAAEFATADDLLKTLKTTEFHCVPGEHDVLDQSQAAFLERYGKPSAGKGYYSFDHAGVHFIALVNVMEFKPGGQGRLGAAQIAWLDDDLHGRPASQPLVIFTHIPLWSLYPQWGWSTEDWPQAMELVKRFGSVTVLNGHIHQVVQKVEGTVRYATARSTAYPQPAAGRGSGPGPLKVPADQLRSVLGVRRIDIESLSAPPALTDTTLA